MKCAESLAVASQCARSRRFNAAPIAYRSTRSPLVHLPVRYVERGRARWKSLIYLLPLATFVAVAGGCATMTLRFDHDPEARFAEYKTYGWMGQVQGMTGNPRIDDPMLNARVRQEVNRRLDAKGFALSRTGMPDFLIAWRAAIRRKLEYSKLKLGYDYAPAWGRDRLTGASVGDRGTYVRQYELGTLVIDIVDARDNRLVWWGAAQAEIDVEDSRRTKDARIKKAVGRILSRFPP